MGISENADSPLLCSREIKLMQYPKDDIQKEILKAAEKVFLENGFPKASMREIAQEAQVGLSNIYNYFKSKDDIFCTVVRPVISAFDRMLHEHHGRYGADIMEMYSTESLCKNLRRYIELSFIFRIFMDKKLNNISINYIVGGNRKSNSNDNS